MSTAPSARIRTLPQFDKAAKALAKRYPSLKQDLAQLFAQLEQQPDMGTPLGDGVFKIRMAIASKQRGKSGGARVITFVHMPGPQEVILLYLYDKSEMENLNEAFLDQLIRLALELE